MVQVIITKSLEEEIDRRFKHESIEIFRLMLSLEESPTKGNALGHIGKVLIKEIRYNKFRFYFITDGFLIKFIKSDAFKDLIIKFIRMSEKKDQQKTIEEIKAVLRNLGEEGF